MTMQELEYYMDGYKIRDSLHKEGLRRIWVVLYNSNVEKRHKIVGPRDLAEAWPLYTDVRFSNIQSEEDEADELRAQYRNLVNAIREKDGRSGPSDNVNGGGGSGDPLPE